MPHPSKVPARDMQMVPIPYDQLPKLVGFHVHLAWAYSGAVWVLKEINGPDIVLETPKTGKRFVAKAKDACYTRRHQPT